MINDMKSWTDEQLQVSYDACRYDLEKAAKEEPNGEWHQACFAAFYAITQEMDRRESTIH